MPAKNENVDEYIYLLKLIIDNLTVKDNLCFINIQQLKERIIDSNYSFRDRLVIKKLTTYILKAKNIYHDCDQDFEQIMTILKKIVKILQSNDWLKTTELLLLKLGIEDLSEEIKLSHNLEDLENILKEIIEDCRTAIETDNNNIDLAGDIEEEQMIEFNVTENRSQQDQILSNTPIATINPMQIAIQTALNELNNLDWEII